MSLEHIKLHLIESPDDVTAFRAWLGARRPVNALGFDTESTGLDRFHDRTRLLQFGDGEHGWAMARNDWLGLARWVIGNFTGRFILHNAKFDVSQVSHSCGIELPRDRVDDTMVMARINEPHHSMALKSQAARHVDPAAASLQDELGGLDGGTSSRGWTWAKIGRAHV